MSGRRLAAQVAQELTRRDLELNPGDSQDENSSEDELFDVSKEEPIGDEEQEEMEGLSDGEGKSDKKRKRRRKLYDMQQQQQPNGIVGSVKKKVDLLEVERLKNEANQLFESMMNKNHHPKLLIPRYDLHVYKKKNEKAVDPLLNAYLREETNNAANSNNNNGSSEQQTHKSALEFASTALKTIGTTEYETSVKFAGETITVTKNIEKTEAARLEDELLAKTGLDLMVSGLTKKKGITTIEKTAIDWEKYKADKKLQDELKNASKTGYVEKESFLSRVDQNQFQLELAERERERARRELNAARGDKS